MCRSKFGDIALSKCRRIKENFQTRATSFVDSYANATKFSVKANVAHGATRSFRISLLKLKPLIVNGSAPRFHDTPDARIGKISAAGLPLRSTRTVSPRSTASKNRFACARNSVKVVSCMVKAPSLICTVKVYVQQLSDNKWYLLFVVHYVRDALELPRRVVSTATGGLNVDCDKPYRKHEDEARGRRSTGTCMDPNLSATVFALFSLFFK